MLVCRECGVECPAVGQRFCRNCRLDRVEAYARSIIALPYARQAEELASLRREDAALCNLVAVALTDLARKHELQEADAISTPRCQICGKDVPQAQFLCDCSRSQDNRASTGPGPSRPLSVGTVPPLPLATPVTIELSLDVLRSRTTTAFVDYVQGLDAHLRLAVDTALNNFNFEREVARKAEGLIQKHIDDALRSAFNKLRWDQALSQALTEAVLRELKQAAAGDQPC